MVEYLFSHPRTSQGQSRLKPYDYLSIPARRLGEDVFVNRRVRYRILTFNIHLQGKDTSLLSVVKAQGWGLCHLPHFLFSILKSMHHLILKVTANFKFSIR